MMMNNNLPLVSIITPSYNQGKFIRETIESVLKQDYMKLEHIVIDGGSSDETLQILKEYSNLDSRFRFVSEPDNGQSHAINKGLKLAKGEVIGWLNSDDTYLPGAVNHVVNGFLQNPNWSMVYGSANITNVNNEILSKFVARRVRLNDLFTSCPICQPAVFLRKKTLNELGGIDESLDLGEGSTITYLSSYVDRVFRSLERQALYAENNRQKALRKKREKEAREFLNQIKDVPLVNWLEI